MIVPATVALAICVLFTWVVINFIFWFRVSYGATWGLVACVWSAIGVPAVALMLIAAHFT